MEMNIDQQIADTLRIAGVQLDESSDNVDWSVKNGVNEIARRDQISTHDAMIKYSKEHDINFGDVYDEYMFGSENLSLEEAKKRLESVKRDFRNAQYADDFLYSNGGWQSYEREINHLERVIKKLEEKRSVNESYESKNNSSLEQAIKYINDSMKAKYGREYPKEEDESDYRRELCSAASKKFNISLDEIVDKIASDYVDSMPYVIQDKQGNYSEI